MRSAFFFLPVVVVAGAVYVLWHVWNMLPLLIPHWARVSIVAVLSLCMACLFIGLADFDWVGVGVQSVIYRVGTTSLIALLYLVPCFLLIDLLCLCRVMPRDILKSNGWLLSLVFGAVTILLIYGNLIYHVKKPELMKEYTKKSVNNIYSPRIFLISDLHLGYHIGRDELSEWVRTINEFSPDYVFIAGDIIDRSIRPLEKQKMYEVFHRILAPVYACPGNHEYIAGYEDAEKFCRKAGIHLLRDTVVNLDKGLCLVARDDRTNPRRASLATLMQQVDTSRYVVVLDHQPLHLNEASNNGVDFQFSGHTHHGQVFPINLVTDKIFECANGRYQLGRTVYYVSPGIGIWGGKFRIGTRSAYLVLDIVKNEPRPYYDRSELWMHRHPRR